MTELVMRQWQILFRKLHVFKSAYTRAKRQVMLLRCTSVILPFFKRFRSVYSSANSETSCRSSSILRLAAGTLFSGWSATLLSLLFFCFWIGASDFFFSATRPSNFFSLAFCLTLSLNCKPKRTLGHKIHHTIRRAVNMMCLFRLQMYSFKYPTMLLVDLRGTKCVRPACIEN